ncbi:MAG: gluconate 2-dehydrogenase subunit 3 family protein [Gammaproteobacteria bacterium]|nr:gluconate 2-dehydrogenase subunit 3 family protein [Gammaproteobacteria bacterium]
MAQDDPTMPDREFEPGAQPDNPGRRNLLKGAGLVGAAAIGGSGALIAQQPSLAQNEPAPVREALEVLTAAEVETLEVICDCLIPSDELGPGAREARAAHFIDRALAGPDADDLEAFRIGLAAVEDYARTVVGKPFSQIIRDRQESILLALQQNKLDGFMPSAAGFFNLLRNHTINGTFCDPYYGGNRDFVGWDMIRYPGVRIGASERDVELGADLPPNHQSAYDYLPYTKTGGRPVTNRAANRA